MVMLYYTICVLNAQQLRDFEAIQKNPSLVSGLEDSYKNNSENEETTIIDEFSERIKEYLKL